MPYATLSCSDSGIGLHVAPGAGDGALLSFTTNVGSFTPWLATLTPADVSVRSLPLMTPSALTMSDADGAGSLLVGELPDVGLGYSASTVTPLPDAEPVSSPPGASDFYLPIDGRFAASGMPRALYRLGSGEASLAGRDFMAWSSQMLGSGPLPFSPAGQALALDPSGNAVAVSFTLGASGFDLVRFDAFGAESVLLTGVTEPSGDLRAADAAPGGTTDVPVAFQAADGIHLARSTGAVYGEELLPRTEPSAEAAGCPGPDAPCDCSGSATLCTETSAAGPRANTFALLRAFGELWLVWVDVHIDRDIQIRGVATGICSLSAARSPIAAATTSSSPKCSTSAWSTGPRLCASRSPERRRSSPQLHGAIGSTSPRINRATASETPSRSTRSVP